MPTNPIDLTTVASVKDYANITSAIKDNDIQAAITSFSQWVLNACGLDTLVQQVAFNEWYDGNGSPRLFLRNRPITAVTALTIWGRAIPQSTGVGSVGWVIDQSGKSISLRGAGTGSGGPWTFTGWPAGGAGGWFAKGIQNINVQYTAGYASVPFDLERMARQTVATWIKREEWIDMGSKTLSAGGGANGTTRYRDWPMPPESERILENYKRAAMV